MSTKETCLSVSLCLFLADFSILCSEIAISKGTTTIMGSILQKPQYVDWFVFREIIEIYWENDYLE